MVSYVFFGKQGVDEAQVLLPIHELLPNGLGVNISCDYSYDLDQTIRFYFHWDDNARDDPGLYNFRIVFMY